MGISFLFRKMLELLPSEQMLSLFGSLYMPKRWPSSFTCVTLRSCTAEARYPDV
jgi:hypothetical protein